MMRSRRIFVSALVGVTVLLMAPGRAAAKPHSSVLHAFTLPGLCPDGSALAQAGDGNLYGTTRAGGVFSGGTAFRLDRAGVLTTLHHFRCANPPGCQPSGLISARDGFLYGMTGGGGETGQGTIFRMDDEGTVTHLHSFDCGNGEGCSPDTPLVEGADGSFYGSADGTMFKIDRAGRFTSFRSKACSGRCGHVSALIQGTDGSFYGTTSGVIDPPYYENGTAFRMDGAGAVTRLTGLPLYAGGPLVQATDGFFYTVTIGGPGDWGTVIRFDATGASRTELHRFDCASVVGCQPTRTLVQGKDGFFYGTTARRGYDRATEGKGSVFRMDASGAVIPVASPFLCDGAEGCFPGSLTQGTDGNLYGTTTQGAAGNAGTVFKVAADGRFTTLHAFASTPEGSVPRGRLIHAGDGKLYGTTRDGGLTGFGTVFSIDRDGTVTTLHSFDCATEGCQPEGGVVEGLDGHLYGTTQWGGVVNLGTFFRLTTTGAYTLLHSFDCRGEACRPVGDLVRGHDGNFYGASRFGGSLGGGAVYRMSPAGAYQYLHDFDCDRIEGCAPWDGLIQAAEGSFYGTASNAIYRIDTAGRFSWHRPFTDCSGTNPCGPRRLLQGRDGALYGLAGGGVFYRGAIFRIGPDPGGALTILHSFECDREGCDPEALMQGSDGDLYGISKSGGAHDQGTLYRLDLSGRFAVLEHFSCEAEGCPRYWPGDATLMQADDGIYGTAQVGPGGGGVLFKVSRGRRDPAAPAGR